MSALSFLFKKIKENYVSILRYLICGGAGVVLDYAVLFILTHFFGVYYLYSVTVSYLCGFILNFFLNKFWTFKKKENTFRQLLKYSLLAGFNFVITLGLMYLLTSMMEINYLISRGIVFLVITCWNFFLYKLVVYK